MAELESKTWVPCWVFLYTDADECRYPNAFNFIYASQPRTAQEGANSNNVLYLLH